MHATAHRHIASDEKPDITHAHSPALNAIAPAWAGKKPGIPTVYEIRAFWEDAAVGNGADMPSPIAARGKEELRVKLGLDGKIVLGFFGSYYPYEGLDILLDAIALLRHERNDIAVILAGGGPAEEELKWPALRLGIEDCVTSSAACRISRSAITMISPISSFTRAAPCA